MVQITTLMGNSQKLDGGAMFGNAPKALWTRWMTPDEANRVDLACRAALFTLDDGRTVLLETGIGAFFEPQLKDRFGVVEANHVLLDSLAAHGLTPSDIDVVVLSHLHFDHAGGLLSAYDPDTGPSLLFDKAKIVVSRGAWERALKPHARDRASFIPVLHDLLQASGRLAIVDADDDSAPTATDLLGPGFAFHVSHGHTPGLLLTEIPTARGPVVFGGDLIPGAPWMHVPITMGYDRYPELLIDEKHALLTDLEARGGHVLFTHDPHVALGTVAKNERGKYHAADPQAALSAWPQP